MRITYIDTALWQATGHHFDWAYRVCKALVQRGHDVDIYCSDRLNEDAAYRLRHFKVHPLFSFNPYVNPNKFDELSGELEKQWIGFHAIGAELSRIPEADLCICPTMFSHEFMAYARSGKKTPLSFGIHHPPKENAAWWKLAGKILEASPSSVRVVGVSLEQNVSNVAAVLPQFKPQAFPVPADGHPNDRDILKTVGFLGAHRSEKGGAALISNLIRLCFDKGFSVLVNSINGLPDSLLKHPLLKVCEFNEDFGVTVEACDLVVVPYRWEDYVDRASGLIYHTRASGVPVIVPKGATFTKDLMRAGSCILFDELNEQSISTAIDGAIAIYKPLKAAALTDAKNWQKHNGLEKFVDFLLGTQIS